MILPSCSTGALHRYQIHMYIAESSDTGVKQAVSVVRWVCLRGHACILAIEGGKMCKPELRIFHFECG